MASFRSRSEQKDDGKSAGEGRREFLQKMGAMSAAAMTASVASGCAAAEEEAAVDQSLLPQVRIGRYNISRLVCGANTFNAGSHLSIFVNHEMRAYYTTEQILKTLRRCEEVGVNCWQGSSGNFELYRQFVDQGLKMHYMAIHAGDPKSIADVAGAGGIGIAHHGETTDRYFKTGQLDKVNEYLKRVRDAGLLVGVSTHMPDVVDAIESKGWDLDYYMTCIYERHRSVADLEKLLGQAPIPAGEVYLPNDPPRMFKAIRATKRPCLAFKILAAGRLSDRHAWVERAFKDTLASIKPNDGVIVGLYDKFSDQAGENAAMVKRFSA